MFGGDNPEIIFIHVHLFWGVDSIIQRYKNSLPMFCWMDPPDQFPEISPNSPNPTKLGQKGAEVGRIAK